MGGGWDLEEVTTGSQGSSSARSGILNFDSLTPADLLQGLIHLIPLKDLPWGKWCESHFKIKCKNH